MGDPEKILRGREVGWCQGRLEETRRPARVLLQHPQRGSFLPAPAFPGPTSREEGGFLRWLPPGACGPEVHALLESWWGGGGAGQCCELPPAAAAMVARVTREGAQVGGSRPASSAGGRGLELPCHHGNGAAISKPRVVPVARCQGVRVLQDSGNLLQPGT